MIGNKNTKKIVPYSEVNSIMGTNLPKTPNAGNITRYLVKLSTVNIIMVSEDILPLGAKQKYHATDLELIDGGLYRVKIDLTPEEIVTIDRAAFLASRAVIVQAIKVTTAAGNTFDGCEVSRGRMGDAVTGLDDVQTIRWVLADGSNMMATKAELKEALYLIGREEEAVWVEAT